MTMLTYQEFYDKVNTEGNIHVNDIRPYLNGIYIGSTYDAYLIWYKLEHSPLGEALR